MLNVPTAAEKTVPTDAPPGPPPVVVVKSEADTLTFAYRTHVRGGLRLLVIGASVLPITMFAMWLTGAFGSSLKFIGPVLGIQCAIFLIVAGRMIFRYSRAWRLDRTTFAAQDDRHDKGELEWQVKGVLLEVGGLWRSRWWTSKPTPEQCAEFQRLLVERRIPRAITIVQAELIDNLNAIPVEATFVEPERVVSAIARRSRAFWWQVVAVVFFIWMTINSALNGEWIPMACGAVVLAMAGIQILRTYGINVSDETAPIVGMGVFSDHKGRRWTVHDSVAYLYPMKAGFRSFVMLLLVGPDGAATKYFQGADDLGLRLFWQRWMHPHPRPELV